MEKEVANAIVASDVKGRRSTTYPVAFRENVAGRTKRVLGDVFELTSFGVNLVTLSPASWSAQRHWHTREDEFVYVLSGELVLVTDEGDTPVSQGMIAGFPAGQQNGHHLVNRSDADATYLEIGARHGDDECFYPDIDLQLVSDGGGGRHFTTRAGKPYEDG